MRRHLLNIFISAAVLVSATVAASAQTGPLRGTVKLVAADGTSTPVANATIDIYRTDVSGELHTKSDKRGEWVFAGLLIIGQYTVSVSAPGAAPQVRGGLKAGRDEIIAITLTPGDGRKLTRQEAIDMAKGGGGGSAASSNGGSGGGETAAAKAKRDAENAKVAEENKKIENANKTLSDAFKNGNAALIAGNEADKAKNSDLAIKSYTDAIQQYDSGINADPEHPGVSSLLTNKSVALRSRGVDRYNAAFQIKDDAAKTAAAVELAKADFTAAAEASTRAVELIKKQTPATDPEGQKQYEVNKYFASAARAEAMRLFVSKSDPTKVDDGVTAYQEYMAIETDPVKKAAAQLNLAKMLLDVGAGDRAFAEYQKILEQTPDDPEANRGAGLALFSTGDKAKYQQAANYLQKFVDKASNDNPEKQSAKEALDYLKSAENVVPEKTTTPPPRRKRP